MKETRTAKATPDCPTLLHYIARVLLRTEPKLTLFIDELPSLEPAARSKPGPIWAPKTGLTYASPSFFPNCFTSRPVCDRVSRQGRSGDTIDEAAQGSLGK